VTLIHPEVLARWAAFSEPLEGRKPFAYLDTHEPPIVTVGVGCAIFTREDFRLLPWVRPDNVYATVPEIDREWERVTSMPGGMVAEHYESPHGLHLTDASVDALMRKRLDAAARALSARFPAFSDWPWQAQMGALSLAWAMGAGFPAKYPKWSAAARDQDWATCARECGIQSADNPGVVARNDANRRLFEEAART
jgi:hypothetical protein